MSNSPSSVNPGWLPILSASFLLIFWILFAIFLPMQEDYVHWVLDEDWTWINVIGFIGSALGIFALAAIMAVYGKKEAIDLSAYGLTVMGVITLTSVLFFEAFILKGIALQNPDLIRLDAGFYQQTVFRIALIGGGIIFSMGMITWGIRMLFRQTFKRWKIILLMVGCPLFGIVVVPGNLRLVGVLLYCIAFISIGIEMIKNNTFLQD